MRKMKKQKGIQLQQAKKASTQTHVMPLDSGRFAVVLLGDRSRMEFPTNKAANDYLEAVGKGQVNFEGHFHTALPNKRAMPLALNKVEPVRRKAHFTKADPERVEEPKKPVVEGKNSAGGRPLSFEEACARFTDRFTMEHIPTWAKLPVDGQYYAPRYTNDKEWYAKTEFIGFDTQSRRRYMRQHNPSFPMGRWLKAPYKLTDKLQTKVANRKIKATEPVDFKKVTEDIMKRAQPTVHEAKLAARKKPAKGKVKSKNVPTKRKK